MTPAQPAPTTPAPPAPANSQFDGTIDVQSSVSNGGFAYIVAQDFGVVSDSQSNNSASTLRVFEDGIELGDAHSVHQDIRDFGSGRFSHWGGQLYFSASDSSDPGSNGRVYTYIAGSGAPASNNTPPVVAAPAPVATTPTASSNDPRTRLLASPDRMGFGANATGGSNYVYVRTFAELKSALEQSGNYVLLDPSLSGRTITFTHTIYPADNTTFDGSLAPGHSLVASPNMTGSINMLNVIGGSKRGNQIFHSIKMDGNYSQHRQQHAALQIAHGRDFWIDHVEITDFVDDGILVGFTQNNGADYITVSNCKMYNTDKALYLFYQNQVNHGQGHVTAFFNELAANDRNPLNRGGEHFHFFNNWIHDWKWGSVDSGGLGITNFPATAGNRTVDSNMLSESNVLESPGASNRCGERADPAPGLAYGGWIYTDGQSIYNGHPICNASNHVHKSSTSGPGAPNIPYSYQLLPANQVRAYVEQNAGTLN